MNRSQRVQSITSNVAFINDIIVQKGHSMEEFKNFLATKKLNGQDLTYWTIDELMNAAIEFQLVEAPRHYDYPLIEEEKQQKINASSIAIEPPQPGSILYSVNQHMNNQPPQRPDENEVNKYYSVVPCAKLELNPLNLLSQQNIHAELAGYKMIEGKLFEKAYIEYNVKLVPIGHQVDHRFRNFVLLQEYLQGQYPEFIIPPLPKKKGKSRKCPEIRMAMLDRFLNRVLSQIEFRADPIVETFFQRKHIFPQAVKDQQRQGRNTDFSQVASPSGQLTLQISEQMDTFFTNVQESIKPQTDIIKKYQIQPITRIRRQTKQVIAVNSLLQTELRTLANLFTQNFYIQQRVNQKTSIGKNLKGEGVNIVLNNLFMRWSQKYEEQSVLLKKHIQDFYKFNLRELEGLNEIIEEQNQMKYAVNKKLRKLNAEKTQLFESRNFDRWEVHPSIVQRYGSRNLMNNQDQAFLVMLPVKSLEVWHERDNLAYKSNKVFEQLLLMADTDAREIAANVIDFSVQQQQIFEGSNFWTDVVQAMNTFGADAKLLKTQLARDRLSSLQSL